MLAELRRIVERLAPSAAAWFVDELEHAPDRSRFHVAFSGAGRRLGTGAIGEMAAAQASAAGAEAGVGWPATAGVDECGRAALLLAATADAHDDHVPLVGGLLRRGEVRERQAVLRVMAALPAAQMMVDLAIDACRTNIVTVFEAIACDNAYPARWFGDAAYFQMVLKALFIGVPVGRIVGLRERATDELVRMVDAFASERRAAGRPVPSDALLIRRRS